MARKATVYSENGQFKIELQAYKDYWLVYARIGAEVTLYMRHEHKNTWGSTVEWQEAAGGRITIENVYSGSIPTGQPPPAGQHGPPYSFPQTKSYGGTSHADLNVWATGLFAISVNFDTGGVGGGGSQPATLIVSKVTSTIVVDVNGQMMRGQVDADTYLVDQSTW